MLPSSRIPVNRRALWGSLIRSNYSLLMGVLLLTLPCACRQNAQTSGGKAMRVSVGEIKEVTLSARSPIVGASDNQEVVDVSQKRLSPADSTALQQGNTIPQVFLIKGVTLGTARVVLSEKATDAATGRVRKAYKVQVVTD